MRTKYPARCTRRRSDLEDWARDLIAEPARYGATEREAGLVSDLLLELAAGR